MITLTPENAEERGKELKNSQRSEARLASDENPEITAISQASEKIIQDYKTETMREVLTTTYEAEMLIASAQTKAAEEKLGITATPKPASGG